MWGCVGGYFVVVAIVVVVVVIFVVGYTRPLDLNMYIIWNIYIHAGERRKDSLLSSGWVGVGKKKR